MTWYVIIKIKVLYPRSGSHRKVKQNDNLCPVQDSSPFAVFKVTARDQGQYKGLRGHLLYTVTFLIFFCISKNVLMQVWSKSIYPSRRYGIDKPFSIFFDLL